MSLSRGLPRPQAHPSPPTALLTLALAVVAGSFLVARAAIVGVGTSTASEADAFFPSSWAVVRDGVLLGPLRDAYAGEASAIDAFSGSTLLVWSGVLLLAAIVLALVGPGEVVRGTVTLGALGFLIAGALLLAWEILFGLEGQHAPLRTVWGLLGALALPCLAVAMLWETLTPPRRRYLRPAAGGGPVRRLPH